LNPAGRKREETAGRNERKKEERKWWEVTVRLQGYSETIIDRYIDDRQAGRRVGSR